MVTLGKCKADGADVLLDSSKSAKTVVSAFILDGEPIMNDETEGDGDGSGGAPDAEPSRRWW